MGDAEGRKKDGEWDLALLDREISLHPDDEELRLRRAEYYWKRRDIPRCLADYDAAIRINPKSRALHLKTMALNVMNYYYKDTYNP